MVWALGRKGVRGRVEERGDFRGGDYMGDGSNGEDQVIKDLEDYEEEDQ